MMGWAPPAERIRVLEHKIRLARERAHDRWLAGLDENMTDYQWILLDRPGRSRVQVGR